MIHLQKRITDFIVNGKNFDKSSLIPGGEIADIETALNVYREGYYARFYQVLENTFSKTKIALGEGAFDSLANDFIEEHTSESFDLDSYGRFFPKFLKENSLFTYSELAHLEHVVHDVSRFPQHAPVHFEKYKLLEKNAQKIFLAPSLVFVATENSIFNLWSGRTAEKNNQEFLIVYKKNSKTNVLRLQKNEFYFIRDLKHMRVLMDCLKDSIAPSLVQKIFQILAIEGLITDIIQ